ncbi:MAG: tail fiber protein [bacterium]|nr:tail fiber protein [bacterium]
MNQYLGTVKLFAIHYAPRGWLRCEGQLLQIEQYEPLYTLLGTTYGGNGETTFALPDLRDKAPAKDVFYNIFVLPDYPGSHYRG